MRNLIFFISTLFALASGVSYAAAASASVPAPTSAVQNPITEKDYCPAVNQLMKKDLFWGAPGGWVSYGESWDEKVERFVKAQWVGINVGKIICIYTSGKKNSFPIALEQKQNQIVYSPTGVNWGKEVEGYKECHPLSGDVKDCPFLFEKEEQTGNVYEGLDFFKGKQDNEDD